MMSAGRDFQAPAAPAALADLAAPLPRKAIPDELISCREAMREVVTIVHHSVQLLMQILENKKSIVFKI